MVIRSADNEKIKNLKKLNDKKHRKLENLFLIEGTHLINEAYKNGCLVELIKEEGIKFSLDVPTIEVTKEIIGKISLLDTPTSMIGVCKMCDEKNILGNRLLILDGIQDPGNLGTIIRSAVAFNIDTLIVGSNTVDIYNAKAIRASQGMIFHTNIIERDLLTFIPELQLKGYVVYGTNVVNGKKLNEIKNTNKYAIIVGNEGSGVNPIISELCDEFIYIKMNSECESLNVAVAASIILYEFDK